MVYHIAFKEVGLVLLLVLCIVGFNIGPIVGMLLLTIWFLMFVNKLKLQTGQSLAIRQIAHDLKSPVTVLNLLCKHVGSSQHALHRLNHLSDDLDHLQRCSREQASMVSLRKLLIGIIKEKESEWRKKIRSAFQDDLLARVNPPVFCRIISNLINNAFEAQAGRLEIALKKQDEMIVIEICDNGHGIDPKILSRLGKLGESYGKPQGKGLGLYHAICMIKNWGGRMTIRSASNQGTRITIFLPRTTYPLDAVLIDDDPLIRAIWEQTAKDTGIRLKTFAFPDLFVPEHYSCQISIYIDSHLGRNVRGEVVAKKFYKKGFTNIYMSSGNQLPQIPYWIKGVLSKRPPWCD